MSVNTGNFVLRVRKFRYERAIDVDNDKTTLITDVQFNDHDGTSSVTQKQTTKAMSRNPAARQAVSYQLGQMREEGVTLCLALEKEWKINSGDFDESDEDGLGNMRRAAEKAANETASVKPTNWNQETGEYEWPKEDSDGGPDDEKEPGEKQLSFTAPAAGKGRKPRSNAPPVEV